jgi:uncharacterized membrane protein YccC
MRLQQGEWRWGAGLRAALAIGTPMGLFTLAGHQDMGLLAGLGGFTALYGTDRPLAQQLRLLPVVALGLMACAALGAAVAHNPWWTAMALVAVTAVAATLSWGVRLGPPGALLFVLVAAITAHARRELDWWTVPALVATGAAISMMWVVFSARLKGRWATGQQHLPYRSLDLNLDDTVRKHAGRVTAGVALACLASLWLDAFRLHWVVVTTMAILQAAHDRSFALVRVVQRVVGTLLGLALFEGVLQAHPHGAALVGLVMVLQFAVEVVIFRNYMLGLLFITPLALTLATFGQELDPASTMSGRLYDTLLGAAVALVVLGFLDLQRKMKTKVT